MLERHFQRNLTVDCGPSPRSLRPRNVTINIPFNRCAAGGGSCSVRDVHGHADLGKFAGSVPVSALASHNSVFYVLS